MSGFLTVLDVATRFNKTTSWVRAEARSGRLPALKIGRDIRFAEADLDAYLEACRVKGAADPLRQTPTSRARKRRAS